MSRLVSRILLAILMLPMATVFYIFMMVASEQALRGNSYYSRNADAEMFVLSGILTWLFVAFYWCLLWKSSVKWDSSRVIGTLVVAGGAALAGVLAGALATGVIGRSQYDFGIFIGGLVAILLWLIATVFLWRETAAERTERMKMSSKSAITCPTCGYNLTGLNEARCPECGAKFTLDELMALQPNADRDIE